MLCACTLCNPFTHSQFHIWIHLHQCLWKDALFNMHLTLIRTAVSLVYFYSYCLIPLYRSTFHEKMKKRFLRLVWFSQQQNTSECRKDQNRCNFHPGPLVGSVVSGMWQCYSHQYYYLIRKSISWTEVGRFQAKTSFKWGSILNHLRFDKCKYFICCLQQFWTIYERSFVWTQASVFRPNILLVSFFSTDSQGMRPSTC